MSLDTDKINKCDWDVCNADSQGRDMQIFIVL